MRQEEFAQVRIEGEAVDAVADGQHQHGGGAVERIAGSHLGRAGLQEVLLRHGVRPFGRAQHREDAAHRDVDIDVRGTVERVEHQQVLAARIARGDLVWRLHFLRGHAGQVAAPLVDVQEGLVA
ncbi:hypothetical protein D3C72_1615030 [compost metagenome]